MGKCSDKGTKIISLAKFRQKKNPIHYAVYFTHDETGCHFSVQDIADTPLNRLKLAEVLECAAKSIRDEINTS